MSNLRASVCKKLGLSATAAQTDIYRAALGRVALSWGDIEHVLINVRTESDGSIAGIAGQHKERLVSEGYAEKRQVEDEHGYGRKVVRYFLTSRGESARQQARFDWERRRSGR